MRVIKRKTLREFYSKHPTAKVPLECWFAEAKMAKWAKPSDIKGKYRSADFLKGNRVVFDIKGNDYRLVVKIAYKPGIIFIRFVGTHKEYDRINAETI
ncbi:MAG TPA: addiction module toxin RelE [Lentisphaeria bacterium]|nr:MAG: addiction module toxin RelE [Lentisphaerae bacterium GWF2_49_21]HBC88014.1 addiction module toxin RelE [Lentisphaeria bacterium]